MTNVRELLESVVPKDEHDHLRGADVRRLGRRRQRRDQAVNVVVGVTAAAVSIVGVVRFVAPISSRGLPSTTIGPSPRASSTARPAPTLTGPDFAALNGTRWIPDLINAAVSTQQAYPDERGNAPRALVTFEPGHVLVVDYIEDGRTTTVRGTWVATSDTPEVDVRARGLLRLSLATPPNAPSVLVLLINRLSLVSAFAMFTTNGPPPSLEALTMSMFHDAVGLVAVDLVKPDLLLPSPYPLRP